MSWDSNPSHSSTFFYPTDDLTYGNSHPPISSRHSSIENNTSTYFYEQYLTSFKSEQSEHLPYLFENIVYPQPCSPPSPTNDSTTTYYQLDQTNGNTIINKTSCPRIQPIIYHQLSLIEPISSLSTSEQKLPRVERFFYESNTTITPSIQRQHHLPYARLESSLFGIYEIWQEKTIVGRRNSHHDVDVHIGLTTVVSRVHFELILINGNEFHLKCRSKNGLFINNNYTHVSSTTILPRQCTLRFPSTDLSISFSSLLHCSEHQQHSIPMEHPILLVDVKHSESINDLPNGNSSCSSMSNESPGESFLLGSSDASSAKQESNENLLIESDTDIHSTMKINVKPPYSYAQLIVQAILSSTDRQMTLSQIYNYITAQYPYYESNHRGWQNSIRHNLSLNRYFVRLARKENDSGKGSFWRLDETCEEKLIDHAYRHRKQRQSSSMPIISPLNIKHESDDFLLMDFSSSMQDNNNNDDDDEIKRKRDVEELLCCLTEIIDQTMIKRRKIF